MKAAAGRNGLIFPALSLAAALSSRRARGRCGFVPFLTAGDPSLAASAANLRELAAAGADIIELGVPFSDPMADGPVIQAADHRALERGVTLQKVLSLVARLRREGFATPVILFTYLNPVWSMGAAAFARACRKSGVDGVLVVDLPGEEWPRLGAPLRYHGIEPVLLASPTTSDARLRALGRASGSIVYYVSREGVTGVRRGLAKGIAARLRRVRALTGKAVIVGFGVATARQARALSALADGVVVGSALVAAAAGARGRRRLGCLARSIVAGL